VIEAIFSEEQTYLLCAECEAVLVIESAGGRCPTHGMVGKSVVRTFTPGAVETWLLPETYELLSGKRSRRHREEPKPTQGRGKRRGMMIT
jgi:hypothetical protein